ncbi:hypothetical protein L1785_11615 [Antribacter sp. KLBMP9083]|uniref:Tetratricopeptide repeat protein n=1 Tax=Antribacter soli TaxID=2910976 RepID=A0AA41QDU0_9MICO|nr:hypothetical protein [Antribacter soli]MCF4121630.1 hypothetical protein [Antribacter soli]
MSSGDGIDPRRAVDEALRGLAPVRQIVVVNEYLADRVRDPADWVAELAAIADRNGLAPHVLRRCVSNLAWQARDLGAPLPAEDLPAPEATASWRKTMVYARASRLRYDFKFDQLLAWARAMLAEFPEDGMIRAFAAFAALGGGKPQAASLLASATAAEDYDQTCRFLCLHGLWMSTGFPGAARLAVELADEMIGRGEDDPNVHYWRAGALRREGRLDEALVSINTAIDLLAPGNNAVHQDFARERELISATKVLDDRVNATTERLLLTLKQAVADQVVDAQREIQEQHARARQIVSESLIGIIEVLAIFVTLAGFLVGSGTVLVQAHGFWQNLAGVVTILLGCVTLFVLLRKIVNQGDAVALGIARGAATLRRLRGRSRR